MSEIISIRNWYYFMGGAVVGKVTGLIPTVIISGILLYVADPSIFSYNNIIHNKDFIVGMIGNITKIN